MLVVPNLKDENILLRETIESDIEDRLIFGRPKEFVYMCGGDVKNNVDFPERAEWENWYRYSHVKSHVIIKIQKQSRNFYG